MSRRPGLRPPDFRAKGKVKARKGGTAPAPRPAPSGGAGWLVGLAFLAGVALTAWVDRTWLIRPVPHPAPVPAAVAPPAARPPNADPTGEPPVLSPPPAPKLSPPPVAAQPRVVRPRAATGRIPVAIVMDDAGANLAQVRETAAIGVPLTLAVIPHLPASRESAELWHSLGREVILHLPMEAEDAAAHAPGAGALRPGMSEAEVRETVALDLAAVPHLSGVNNHMGSRATRDRALMDHFTRALRPSGLYFLDSRTAGSSVAYETARRNGLRAAYRSGTFLDNERTEPAIRAALQTLLAQARAQGGAVGIGHVTSPETLRVLRAELPGLQREFEFVPASRFAQ